MASQSIVTDGATLYTLYRDGSHDVVGGARRGDRHDAMGVAIRGAVQRDLLAVSSGPRPARRR